MTAKLSADLLVLLHLLFILYVVLGGLLVFKWQKSLLLHLPCVVWASLLELYGWICPMTPLENSFRQAAGEDGYAGGFIEHYLLPLIYPEDLDRNMQLVLGGTVIALNLAIYALVLIQRYTKREN